VTEAGARKRGRPRVEYSEKYHPAWARSLSRRGLTREEIAREMGISRALLNKWEKMDETFCDALKETKSEADSTVEASLFRRALGYEVEEVRVVGKPEAGGTKTLRVEKVKKQVLPDVTAQIFWLKNRRPDLWRDVQRMEHGGRVEVGHDPYIGKLLEDPEAQRLLAELHARAVAGGVDGTGED